MCVCVCGVVFVVRFLRDVIVADKPNTDHDSETVEHVDSEKNSAQCYCCETPLAMCETARCVGISVDRLHM